MRSGVAVSNAFLVRIPLIILVTMLSLGGCSRERPTGVHVYDSSDPSNHSPFTYSHVSQLVALRTADPRRDARQAVQRGDFRLVGFAGTFLHVPSIDMVVANKEGLGVKIVTGTGDYIKDDTQAAVQEEARGYAKAYNVELLRIITNKGNR